MKPKSKPLEETEAFRDIAGFEACVFDAILSKSPAPLFERGELTPDATGGDLGPPNPVRPAKRSLDGDWVC